MKLKDYVDTSILTYPTLFKLSDYESSRLAVLRHLFLVIGNGLEWHPDGFLAHQTYNGGFEIIDKPRRIPKNFFSDKMWELNILKENVKEVKSALKGFYSYVSKKAGRGKKHLIFLCNDEEFVKNIFEKYNVRSDDEISMDKFFKEELGRERIIKPRQISNDDLLVYTPYPMCEYSALVEMINMKTNSPHIDNFELTNVKEDWKQGAVDVAKNTLEFYKDPNRYIEDHYHPSKALRGFKNLYDQDPKKFRADRVEDGMLPEHTIEQWCDICWEKHLKEQIGYCEKLLEMYDKK